ncbi:nidogen-like [Oppia nitens]|uniref:nidogen-like n=1 Tax=Oppia nitens TaxID=1686743 RepID=UPI0023DB99F4|nr:nidogen-like [Oppia nitens]
MKTLFLLSIILTLINLSLSLNKDDLFLDCRTYQLCDINADCAANTLTQRHQCQCRAGYRGDGIVCIEESESCELLDNCGENAECISDEESNNAYYCACNPGYVGDGYVCYEGLNHQSCDRVNNCHTNGQCVNDPRSRQHHCKCNPGFIGNGLFCIQSTVVPDECNEQLNNCSHNANCVLNSVLNRHECRCSDGHIGDGKHCIAKEDATCDLFNNCHPNANCAYDLNLQKHTCQCNPGFKGDGKQCKQLILSCNIINNCDVKAKCEYSFDAQGYRCQCIDGFIGDGLICRPSRTCREDPTICDVNADCMYSEHMLGHVCHCRYGFVGDGFECSPAPQHDGDYLIFSQGMSLLRMPLQITKQNKGKLLLTKSHQIPAGLDIDCLDGLVYWTDVAHGLIYKSLYNGSSVMTILNGSLGSPEGLAIDWVSRNIYWTDSLKDTIEVLRIDTKMHKVLIDYGLEDPRGIVVHPGSGKMYWSDWSRSAPKIEVANLDGTGRTVLINTDLGLPNNLALDYDRNDLCWTDAGLHRIECIDLYSNSRRVIHTPTAYPFDLSIVGNSIYWTDWEMKSIQKVDRTGGSAELLELPLGGNGRLYSIVNIPRHCPRISNHCAINNGGCRHLCLPNGSGRTCICPDSGDDSCNEVIPK